MKPTLYAAASATVSATALAAMLAFGAGAAQAAATVGQPAPAFSAVDTSGKTVSLADFKGKHVVVEWVNPGCPYVQEHYGSANMQGTQQGAVAQGVVWLAVNSTAPDAGEYKTPAAMAQGMPQQKAAATATLMDCDGKVGRAYGARTTPHMYIVDPAGTLVYAGAIDSKPTSNAADFAAATNHVKVALAESLAGKPVSTASTRAENAADNSSWDPQARLLEFTNLIQKEDAGINIEKLKGFSSDELNKVQVKVSSYLSEFTKKINEAGNAGVHLIKTNKLQTSNFNYGNTGPQKIFYKWSAFKKGKIEDIVSKRTLDAVEKNKWHNDKSDTHSIDTIISITSQLNHLASETLNYIEANKEKYSLFLLIQKNIYALILLNEIQKLSNDLRDEEQIVFISDFNNKIAKIVADEPTPFIYERLGERYNHYLLDEFQDTSTLQWHNLLPLIDNSLRASNNFNMIVGDGKQSIYRWRNANCKAISATHFY